MLFVLVILVLCMYATNGISHDLPDYFPRCSIDDPNLNTCLLNAFNTVRPYVRKGVEEIGLVSFKPLVIPQYIINQETAAANYTVTLWNLTVRRLDNYEVKEISYDPNTLILSIKMNFEPVPISFDYKLSGRILHIPVDGEGFAQTVMGPTNSTIEICGKLIKLDGIEYYNTTKFKVNASVANGYFDLQGLFGGDEELGRLTNKLLNRFSVDVVQAITPAIEQIPEDLFMRFIKSFTGSIPYNKILPKSNN